MRKGSHLTDEQRTTIGARMRGHPGHPCSAETRAKLMGNQHCRGHQNALGYRWTDEQRAKVVGRLVTDATRAKISASSRGHQNSLGYRFTDEQRARNSAAHRAPEARAKMRAAHLGHSVSEETRAKLRAAGMGHQNGLGYRWTDEQRAKTMGNQNALGYRWTEEQCAVGSAALLRYYEDPAARAIASALSTRHGHARIEAITPTYKTWCSMRQRCNNPNAPNYPRYGGRGITCEPWIMFERFLAEMGERTIDECLHRIDNDGPYCRENCVWIDKGEHTRLHHQQRREAGE